MPSATSAAAKKFFLNKRFYLHVRGRINTHKAAELIKIFGGQIDEFLESTVSYVLTDIPKREWPPAGADPILKRARSQNVKLMSLHDLTLWCSKYLSSQSSSDEDDDSKVQVTELKDAFIKIEDINGYYAPAAKELPNWPKIDYTVPNGKALFSLPEDYTTSIDSGRGQHIKVKHIQNNSAQLTPQMITPRTLALTPTLSSSNITCTLATPLTNSNIVNGQLTIGQTTTNLEIANKSNQIAKNLTNHHPTTPITTNNNLPITSTTQAKGVKRRHSAYCEICNVKLSGRLDDHIPSKSHISNLARLNWNDVHSVIQSIPGLGSLAKMRKGPSESSIRLSDQHEFLCLHKVESVSQLFMNNGSKEIHSLSPQNDRQLVQIQ